MSDLSADTWIAGHSPIPPEKLHALGLVTFNWNACEMALFFIFAATSTGKWSTAWAIGHEMGDVTLCNAIKNLITLSHWAPDVKAKVKDAVALYDANRLNRNHLTHFTASGGSEQVDFMRIRGPIFAPQPIPNSLEDIRRVCVEIAIATEFITALANWFLAQKYPQTPLGPLDPQHPPEPLPETPPRPQSLWRPPPPDPRARKPQPGSFQA